MRRKNNKQSKKGKAQLVNRTTSETRGFLLFSFALFLILSLVSYSTAPESKNILGIMGYTFGWALHALLGLSSYALVLYIGWIGWRLLFAKNLHFLWLKHFYVFVGITSLSMLLSVIESDAPHVAAFLQQNLTPGLFTHRMRTHLGGAPFFYIYRDLPVLSLYHILNTAGVAFFFSSTLVASLLFLFKIRLDGLYQKFMQGCQHILTFLRTRPLRPQAAADIPLSKNTKEVKPEEAKESDFLRFVKLRIPSNQVHEAPFKQSSNALQSPDLLGIQPERNPLVRPSLSRKEQTEIDLEASAPTKKKNIPIAIEEDDREAFKKPTESIPKETSKSKKEVAIARESDFKNYQLPPSTLLTNPKKIDQTSIKKDLKRQAEVLEETLLSFGIEAKVGQINCGPTITSFEVHPAIGVKVQRIKALDNDIALNMEATSIRIIAPIPGKAAVGIEVPNSQPQEVAFKDMLQAYQQGNRKFHIPLLLGQAVNGDYVMSDLTKMPHCIIAGATGSGKSVCINTIIMSILCTAKPDQIKLVMVDPKKVELTPYSRLPHMLAPVITEAQGAAAALQWLVKEMEKRYEILKLVGVRNIDTFNTRTINLELEKTLDREIPIHLPYIVGIIDELADLMMVASQDIETPIARIAQMARAVGIHLILATQRPSREVITGLIKANFPTRLSFKVASRVNSQIVLDEIGAESLLGNGDMLFLPPGSSHLVRAQGAFIRDEDIQASVRFICEQAPPNYLIQSFDRYEGEDLGVVDVGEAAPSDSLYDQAKDIVLSTGNASTTFLQRKLKIGYARAASLMDQLELQGIVGPAEGSKPRKIYGRKGESHKDEQEEFPFE